MIQFLADVPTGVVDSPVKLFQWILLPPLILLVALDGFGIAFRRPLFRRDRVVRFAIWLLAAAAVWNPELTTELANKVGITYGKDLILYGFVLAFLAVSFIFYGWTVRTERQITELVRHIAKTEAQKGNTDSPLPLGRGARGEGASE